MKLRTRSIAIDESLCAEVDKIAESEQRSFNYMAAVALGLLVNKFREQRLEDKQKRGTLRK